MSLFMLSELHESFFFFSFLGACFCQLIDLLFPGSIDMTKVKFESQKRSDFMQNYSLLQTAFQKLGITEVRFTLMYSINPINPPAYKIVNVEGFTCKFIFLMLLLFCLIL